MSRYIAGGRAASAYEVAVTNGFVGTEEQWLDSLVGPMGTSNPTGGAGGALSGTYPNPGLNTTAVDNAVAGTVGDTGTATGAALRATLVPAITTPGEERGYPHGHIVFFTFGGDSDANLYGYAGDGTTFRQVTTTALHKAGRNFRDPSVRRIGEWFYCAATIGFATTTMTLLRTKTPFVPGSWEELGPYSFTGDHPTATAIWAPDLFIDTDDTVRIMYAVATDGDYRPMSLYAKTVTLGAGVPTLGAASLISINDRDDTIDGHVVVGDDGLYHLFYKEHSTLLNGGQQYIEHATAATYAGPYTRVGSGNWANWGWGFEGPWLLRLATGKWRMYFDKYEGGGDLGMYYSDGDADFTNWSTPVAVNVPIDRLRHGSAVRLSAVDLAAMTAEAAKSDHEDGWDRRLRTALAAFDVAADYDGRYPSGRSAAVIDHNTGMGTWADLSGSGIPVTQATAGNQPKKNSPRDALPGSLYFDSTDLMDSAAIAAGLPAPLTAFIVGKRVGTTGSEVWLGHTSATAAWHGLNINASQQWNMFAGSDLASAVTADGNAHVFATVTNGTTSSIMYDGTVIASGTAGTNAPVPAAGALRIGQRYDNTRALNGFLFRVILIRGALTLSQRKQLSYLLGKVYRVTVPDPAA